MIKTNAKEAQKDYMKFCATHSETNKNNTNWKSTIPKPNIYLTYFWHLLLSSHIKK